MQRGGADARAQDVYRRIKGPVVPLNLCFTEAGEVDYAAMRAYADWLCEQGVPILLLTYGSSEYAWLRDQDVWRLTEELAAEVRGRSLFITSTAFWPPPETCRFLQHADAVGADAVKVQVNAAALGSPATKDDVFLRYHATIRDAAEIPLLLWCAGGESPVGVQTIAELARWPNVVGCKNDEDPFYHYYDLIRATRDSGFAVISGGQMRNFVFGFQLGSPAYLCPIAPFRPDIAGDLHRTLLDGRIEEAWQIVFRYEEPWLQAALDLEWLPTVKTAIRLHGLQPADRLGGGRPGHDDEQRERVRRVLEQIFGEIRVAAL
jgi:4-hydroxy-tetrahydrodipicolinate synthase